MQSKTIVAGNEGEEIVKKSIKCVVYASYVFNIGGILGLGDYLYHTQNVCIEEGCRAYVQSGLFFLVAPITIPCTLKYYYSERKIRKQKELEQQRTKEEEEKRLEKEKKYRDKMRSLEQCGKYNPMYKKLYELEVEREKLKFEIKKRACNHIMRIARR